MVTFKEPIEISDDSLKVHSATVLAYTYYVNSTTVDVMERNDIDIEEARDGTRKVAVSLYKDELRELFSDLLVILAHTHPELIDPNTGSNDEAIVKEIEAIGWDAETYPDVLEIIRFIFAVGPMLSDSDEDAVLNVPFNRAEKIMNIIERFITDVFNNMGEGDLVGRIKLSSEAVASGSVH